MKNVVQVLMIHAQETKNITNMGQLQHFIIWQKKISVIWRQNRKYVSANLHGAQEKK